MGKDAEQVSILGDLIAVVTRIEAAKPVMHYATSDAITIGKVFTVKAINGFPEMWLFHPDDFDQHQKELTRYCQLVHIRDWKPTPTDIEQAFLDVLKELE